MTEVAVLPNIDTLVLEAFPNPANAEDNDSDRKPQFVPIVAVRFGFGVVPA
ncbi:Uncharacterised protein [Mycobacteroides abscessus subsp. massiliense]|nr:Uncharacterised protein [Mycobacteroides abscessus subsp. massiliense]